MFRRAAQRAVAQTRTSSSQTLFHDHHGIIGTTTPPVPSLLHQQLFQNHSYLFRSPQTLLHHPSMQPSPFHQSLSINPNFLLHRFSTLGDLLLLYVGTIGIPLVCIDKFCKGSIHQPKNFIQLWQCLSRDLKYIEVKFALPRADLPLKNVGDANEKGFLSDRYNDTLDLTLMDEFRYVDTRYKTVRVQAGITLEELLVGINEHELTLPNFASAIAREYQMKDIVQVGAHGTGASLPPIDDQIISMRVVTPSMGTITLSPTENHELFYLTRCGLGGIGVVGELTIQCVEKHKLVEHTFVSNITEIKKNHKKWIIENKHLKYLWIPYTDTVVVIKCNPPSNCSYPLDFATKYTKDEAMQQLRDLYANLLLGKNRTTATCPDINNLSLTELRNNIYAVNPLNKELVIRVSQAEADFWRKSEGYRLDWNDKILGFDYGGQQLVSETCFPCGTLSNPSMKDLEYMVELMQLIESQNIPLLAPIEQQWSARSKSLMSPASSLVEDEIFSWVGVITNFPTVDAQQRREITEEFFRFKKLTQAHLWHKYSAYEHWANIVVPKDENELAALQARLRKRFPVDAYNRARKKVDSEGKLRNTLVEKLFPPSH